MTHRDEPDQPVDDAERRARADRRRRLDDVFGDVLPHTTSDERDQGRPNAAAAADAELDRWYQDNRPPHHG